MDGRGREFRSESDFDIDYDIVVVFDLDPDTGDIYDNEAKEAYNHMIMRVGRKHIFEFDNSEFNERFLLLRGSHTKLRKYAERKGHKLLLDPDLTAGALRKGDEEHAIAKIELFENLEVSPIYPTDYIYAKYLASCEDLYWKPFGAASPIAGAERLNLLLRLMKAPDHEGGYSTNLRALAQQGLIKTYFPLHSCSQKSALANEWMSVLLPWRLPLISIRNYFGDKVSLLTGLSGHICTWLLLPGAVGIAFEVLQLYFDGWSRHETPVFAYFTALWLIVLNHRWIFKEYILGIFGGSYSRTPLLEERRPQHYGVLLASTVDGTDDVYFPIASRHTLLAITSILCGIIVFGIIGASSGIYYIRYLVDPGTDHHLPAGWTQWIAAIVTAAFIVIAGPFFKSLAKRTTLWENHRTDLEVEKYFGVKLFIFKFTLLFTTFYYIGTCIILCTY
jgi:hypothetical protein